MTQEHLLDELMAVMDAAFDPYWREAWSRRQVGDSLAVPNTFAVLFDAAGEPLARPARAAGFVLSRHTAGEEELLLIAVRPDLRSRGIGGKILERFVAQAQQRGARSIFLEMRANNRAASLYRRSGFVPIGSRREYYRTSSGEPIDAITFARTTST